MVKKLLYLISGIMIVFTGFMFRMRPGQMFKIKPAAQKVSSIDSFKENKPLSSKSFDISDERKVILLEYTGDISVKRKGELIDTRKGMVLGFKDEIISGNKSVAILSFANNSTIKLFSNSEFIITKIQSRERSDINMQYNLFEIKQGAMLVDFVNQGNSHFLEIESPSSRLQIRGTQFLYLHNKTKRRSQLAVREGIVKVTGSTKKTKFVLQNQGLLIKNNAPLGEITEDNWVKKINWSKVSVGSGIDLYNPDGSNLEKDEWKARRKKRKKKTISQVTKNVGMAAAKTKTGGMLKSVVGKVLEVGGAIAKKGVKTIKNANPISKVNDTTEEMKNFEDEQQKKMDLIDSLDED